MLSFLFLSFFAQAQEYYHFDTIAQNSDMFMKSSEVGINKLTTLKEALGQQQSLSSALRSTSAMLSSSDLSKWDTIISRYYDKNTQTAEDFLLAYQTDYGAAYEKKALEYLKAYPKAKNCKTSPYGGSTCQGTDISKTIGKKLDDDQELKAIIKEINARVWPTPVALPTRKHDVFSLTGTSYYIQLDTFISKLFKKKIAKHHRWYNKSFSALDPKSKGYQKNAQKLYQEFEQRLQDDRKTIEKALKVVIKKKKKKDPRYKDLGFCGNPKALGACNGNDITDEVFKALAENKKSVKIIQKAQ